LTMVKVILQLILLLMGSHMNWTIVGTQRACQTSSNHFVLFIKNKF
jgi:hypothetical protein